MDLSEQISFTSTSTPGFYKVENLTTNKLLGYISKHQDKVRFVGEKNYYLSIEEMDFISDKLKEMKNKDNFITNSKPLTEQGFLTKTKTLIRRLEKPMMQRAKHLYNCGGVDPENFRNDFRLPMIVMAVMLEEFADQHKQNNVNETYNNLKHY